MDDNAKSHPTWVRGLKSLHPFPKRSYARVAPHVGAWIEIAAFFSAAFFSEVAPHVGAWIEIKSLMKRRNAIASHPTWVRGLK